MDLKEEKNITRKEFKENHKTEVILSMFICVLQHLSGHNRKYVLRVHA